MENQTAASSRRSRFLQRLAAIVLAIVCLAGIRFLLGSRQMMYLSAKDISRIEVSITPPGSTCTATGDDSAAAVKILNQTVCYGARNENTSGQTVALTIYNHDDTTMNVTFCGNCCTIDGKSYRIRPSDEESLLQWAQTLADAQNTQS